MSQLKELTTTGSFHGLPVVSNTYNPTTKLWVLKLSGSLSEISKDDLSDDELTYIILPDGLTTIGENAFDNCTNLLKITIPESVTSIGNAAFAKNTNLTNIEYRDSDENWKEIAPSGKFAADSTAVINCIGDELYAKNNNSTTVSTEDHIELSTSSEITITVGNSLTCTATHYSNGSATENTVLWSTLSNTEVVSYTINGNTITITPNAKPSSDIIFTASYGDATIDLTIKVVNKENEKSLYA